MNKSKSAYVWFSFTRDWWENKVLKYLKECGMQDKRGATILTIVSIDAWISNHPEGIGVSNNELTALAKKAADKFKGFTP